MPKLTVLPHPQICPKGAEIRADTGDTILDALLRRGIPIDHACEKSCACATCHIVVRHGYEFLDAPIEAEEDMLDKAGGAEPTSRLGCQTRIGYDDLVVEIPPYASAYAGNSR